MWTHFVNGWDKETDQTRLTVDREKSKRLLAEAGYPGGFELTLDCPVGAYDEVCIAIAPMLAQVGIQLKVNTLPPGQMFPRIARGETSFYGLSWGVPTYDAMYTLRGIMMSRAKVGGSLSKAAPYTVKVEHGGTTLFRARFSGFAEQDSAQEACSALKRSGFSCFATRS